MAIYHFSVKAISRKAGRSAVAAAAYRAGEMLIDNRYGKTQDYTKKFGVDITQIYAPDNTDKKLLHRNELWNTVENAESRKDALLAREFEIAFPSELNQQQRKTMLDDLCNMIVEKYNVVVDAAIHAPHTENGSDERNYHAHIMFTTRAIDLKTGLFSTKKYRDFSRDQGTQTVQQWRADFATLTNKHLEKSGHNITVDHRSYIDQDNNLQATEHEGSNATALRRKHQNDASITLPNICKKNDAIKISNAEKRKAVIELQSLENEIKVSESLIANAKIAYDQANEIQQAEIRANAFHQKYYDYVNQVIGKKTNIEKLAVIKATQADELARQYILDFELLKSVNKEPLPKEQGFLTKLFSKKPVIFYDIEEVKNNLSPMGHFQSIFDGAEQEKAAEIQRQTELQEKQKVEHARKSQLKKDKRFADFLLKTPYEVDQLDLKLKHDHSMKFAEQVKKLNAGEIKEFKEVEIDAETQELCEFIQMYHDRKQAKEKDIKEKRDAAKAIEYQKSLEHDAEKEKAYEDLNAKVQRVQQQTNHEEFTPEPQQKPVSINKKSNNKDNDSPTNTPF